MAVERLPLAFSMGEREPGDTSDALLKNCYGETIEFDPTERGAKEVMVTKRPGLKAHTDLSAATTDTGRGIYEWEGNVYSVVGDEVFKGTSDIGQVHTSSGRVYFDQAFDGTGLLIMHDGASLYTIDTSDVIRSRGSGATAEFDDEAMPVAMVSGLVVLDQYACVLDAEGAIHSSPVGDIMPTSNANNAAWDGDTVQSEIRSDNGVAIARYVNYLVSLGEDTVEFFYDAANAVGTPFNRFEGMGSLIGCAAGDTVVNIDQALCWVAKSNEGGRFVAVLNEGFQPQRISTNAIDEILDKEGTGIANAYAYYVRIAGKLFYVLTLPTTAARTFVFDVNEQKWGEWTSDTSGSEAFFTAMDSTEADGTMVLLDDSNGRTYDFDPETFQDNVAGSAENIEVEIRTPKTDSGNMMNKFMSRAQVIGDLNASTGTVNIAYSDDDYQNWSTNRTQDLDNHEEWLTRLGVYKRRAFRIQHTLNFPMRLSALEVNVDQGHYGRS